MSRKFVKLIDRKVAKSGFTIVELLIAIVVIAILASITVGAFNGIQGRANDSAIESDLRAMKQKLEIFYVDNAKYPTNQQLPSLEFRVSKSSYAIAPTTPYNLLFCFFTPGLDQFRAAALSKSGSIFTISSTDGGVSTYSGAWLPQQQDMCVALGAPSPGTSNNRGYAVDDTTTGPWRSWTGG